jgi:glycosyltransferase involved in cell wall biosynthesis
MSFLSVVICTFNRADTLRGTLDRLRDQTLPKDGYEVIVVDDGSHDHTSEMVAQYIELGRMPLKYFRQERKGPGAAHNRGIREARGPLVLLLCDDMQPAPDVLRVHVQAHEQHPEPNVVVLGNVLQSPDLPSTVFLRNWKPFRYDGFEKKPELTYIYFCGCHVSLKRDFILNYGMFIERSAAANEDVEAAWRMHRNGGMRMLYRKDAVTYHNHVETIDSACKRSYERGLNFDLPADRIEDPGVFIHNHLVTWRSLPLIIKGFRTSKPSIFDEDRNIVWYFVREGLRRVSFNRFTVPYIWLPTIRGAEKNRLLARFITTLMLRGVVSYHFVQGYKELTRRRRTEKSGVSPLAGSPVA